MTFEEMWEKLMQARRGPKTFIPQREVARRMGTTQSHVSELENGRIFGPSIDVLERYANAQGYVIVYDLKKVEEMQ